MLRTPGRWLLELVRRLVSFAALTVLSVVALVRRPREGGAAVRSQIARQVVFSTWDGIPLVAFIAALISVSVVAMIVTVFPGFQATVMVGRLVTLLLLRELAPLMAAILVILRSSGAVAVELGYMSWRGEIEALETLGIDPAKFLLLPRYVGLTVATVILTIVYVVATVGAGMLMAELMLVAPSVGYLSANLESIVFPEDMAIALIKSLLFGGTIASVACYHGLSVRSDLTEVPRRGSLALVEALSWCAVISVAITLITL